MTTDESFQVARADVTMVVIIACKGNFRDKVHIQPLPSASRGGGDGEVGNI